MLFLFSMAGPWMFDLIHVPARYPCGEPFVRLEGDYCGLPMSGIRALAWFGLGLISAIAQLVTASHTDVYSRSPLGFLVTLFFASPLFTFVSNLVAMLKHGSQFLQALTSICWGIACLLTLPVLLSGLGAQMDQLWGLWLYIGLTYVMTIFELVSFVQEVSLRR